MDYPLINLEQLPDELLVHILRLLEAQDIFSFYIMTSKEMRKRVDIMFQLPSFEVKSRIILDENIFQFFNVKSVKMDLLEKRVQYSPHSWHTYRNDGPAIIYENGRRLWVQNGELFRPGRLPGVEDY